MNKKMFIVFRTILLFAVVFIALTSFPGCTKEEEPTDQTKEALPLVVVHEPVYLTRINAWGRGEVILDNGKMVVLKGVCWNQTGNPTVSDDKTSEGSGIGRFESLISELIPGTTYYLRAYAKTVEGTSYSEEIVFTTNENTDDLYDIDGNQYNTVVLGTQVWMAENLRTATLNDGTPIAHLAEIEDWALSTTAGYSWRDNNEEWFKEAFGAYYNWAAVATEKLCPEGWKVPSGDDWVILERYLVDNGFNFDNSLTGKKFTKSLAAKSGWDYSDVPGSVGNTDYPGKQNLTLFSALPGSMRDANGTFRENPSLGMSALWWTSIESSAWSANAIYMHYDLTYFLKGSSHKSTGLSVRCVRDNDL